MRYRTDEEVVRAFNKFIDSATISRVGGLFNGDTPIQFEHDIQMWGRIREQIKKPIQDFILSQRKKDREAVVEALRDMKEKYEPAYGDANRAYVQAIEDAMSAVELLDSKNK